MANWFQENGMNKSDLIGLGLGLGAMVLGLGSALFNHRANQVRAIQINNMLDSRVTQPQNTPIKK